MLLAGAGFSDHPYTKKNLNLFQEKSIQNYIDAGIGEKNRSKDKMNLLKDL